MTKRKTKAPRAPNARGARAVKAKNRKLTSEYIAVPVAAPIVSFAVPPGAAARVVVPVDVPVKRVKKMGWMEYLFGTTKK